MPHILHSSGGYYTYGESRQNVKCIFMRAGYKLAPTSYDNDTGQYDTVLFVRHCDDGTSIDQFSDLITKLAVVDDRDAFRAAVLAMKTSELGAKEQRRLSRSDVRSLLLGNTEVGVLRRPSRVVFEGKSGQAYKAYYQDNNTVWYKLDTAVDFYRWDWGTLKTGVVCRGPDKRKLAWCRAITPDGAGGYKAVGFRTGNVRYQFRVEKGLFGLPGHLLKKSNSN